MTQAQQELPPIEDIFDPHSEQYMNDPIPACLELARRGQLVWYEPWQAWIMTRMADIMQCWKTEPLSSDFYDWEFAPARPPEDRWSNFERAMIGHSLLADHDHHRLVRKVVSPAFSRNVVDKRSRRRSSRTWSNCSTTSAARRCSTTRPRSPSTSPSSPSPAWWASRRNTGRISSKVILSFTETWNPTISDEQREARGRTATGPSTSSAR